MRYSSTKLTHIYCLSALYQLLVEGTEVSAMNKVDNAHMVLSFQWTLRMDFKAEIGNVRNSSQVLGSVK